MSSGNQHSHNQGANDAKSGKGPANDSSWTSTQRESYNAGYSKKKS